MSDDLLTIGVFAMWTGLSINALRHYDEIGLLRPVSVDKTTGYRRYQRAHGHLLHRPDGVMIPRRACERAGLAAIGAHRLRHARTYALSWLGRAVYPSRASFARNACTSDASGPDTLAG